MGTERIKLEDTTISMVVKMSEGNFGAMDVLMLMLKPNDIDPDNLMGGVGQILLLDTFEIYGVGIYVLFNDICERDLVKTLAVLRATQMGFFSSSILKEACYKQDRSGKDLIPVQDLYLKVKEQLPTFNSH